MKKIALLIILCFPLLIFAEEKVVGYLGISGKALNEAMKTALDLECGVIVEAVFEDTQAENADIRIGDVILKIDDQKMTDFKVLKNIIQENPGRKVEIEISRSAKIISKTVELGQKEKKRPKIDIDIPDMSKLKEFFGLGKKELQKQLDELKKMMGDLKEEIEELKKQIK